MADCSAVISSSSLFPAVKSTLDQCLFKQKLKFYSVDKVNDHNSSIIELQDFLTDSSEPKPSSEVTFKGMVYQKFY